MARKNDIAGLAALGALGMMLSGKGEKAPVEDRTGRSVSGDTRDYGVDYSEAPTRGRDLMTEPEVGWESGTAPARRPSSGGRTPARPMRDDQYNPDVQQGLRNARDALLERQGFVTSSPGGSYDRPTRLTSAQAMRQLDEQTGVRQGPTEGDGRSVTGNEFTRNLNNTLQALSPSMAGGLGKVRASLESLRGLDRAAQAGDRVAKAADVVEKGKKVAEVAEKGKKAADTAKKGRDAVTNPLEWASGRNSSLLDKKNALSELDTTGGAIGYRKGGKTKKMASGGSVKMSSASRRGDGIAQRGKTRGVMR